MNALKPPLRKAGFTLIELLSVVVVLGILAGIAMPRMDGLTATTKLERAREQFIADLTFARTVAIRNGRSASLCLATLPTASSYEIRRGTSDCSAGSGTPIKNHDLDADLPGVEVRAAADGVPTSVIAFDSRGFKDTTQGALVITILHGSRSESFDVAAIGTVIRND